jgi:hypothetical protein
MKIRLSRAKVEWRDPESNQIALAVDLRHHG